MPDEGPLCSVCGCMVSDADMICPSHFPIQAGWAEGNRVACDFYHRGIVREATPEDRIDISLPFGSRDIWGTVEEEEEARREAETPPAPTPEWMTSGEEVFWP